MNRAIMVGRGGIMFDEEVYEETGLGWAIDPGDNVHFWVDGQIVAPPEEAMTCSTPCFETLLQAAEDLKSKLPEEWSDAKVCIDREEHARIMTFMWSVEKKLLEKIKPPGDQQ